MKPVVAWGQHPDGRWWAEVAARDGTTIAGEGPTDTLALEDAQARRDSFERSLPPRLQPDA